MSIDLALVFPRLRYQASGDPPLGVASIAAYVRSKGYRVAIVDATHMRNFRQVAEEIVRLDPEYVGYSVSTLMLPDVSRIAGWVNVLDQERGRKRIVIAGGPHLSTKPEDGKFLQADHVVQGEGEYATVDIMEGRPPRKERPDLTTLPAPALDMVAGMPRYIQSWYYLDVLKPGWRGTNLLSARNCPLRCTFCQPMLDTLFGRKHRARTPQQIVDEMETLHERYGIDGFFFHTDTLTADHRWLREFLRLTEGMTFFPKWAGNSRVDCVTRDLLHEMAVHGCRALHFGAESGTQRILDEYDKRITLEQIREAVTDARAVGISPGSFWILGAPSETEQECKDTIAFALSLPLDEASFSICTALPGTFLYKRLEAEGAQLSHDFRHYNYYTDRPMETGVPLKRLRELQTGALLSFYSRRKGYIASHLASVDGIRHLWQKARRFA